MRHTYITKGTCARQISFDLEGDIVKNIEFVGGCNGNLKAISSLVNGMSVEDIEKKVRGIKCGFKSTSCSDQLALAVREALEKERK